ncbi:hypothetical protein [Primorskyibacter sp. S87]|uniref:hypothetical protein n=1 Tax=Primorskyibacter sp. S87 TaxID=3415126 RepID=UPI003C79965E
MRQSFALLGALLGAGFLATAGIAQNATVSGTDGTNALGTLPCAAIQGQPLKSCHAELRRADAKNVTISVFLPTGDTRIIYFENGKPTSSNSTSPISSETQGNVMLVFVEPGEVFEIPVDAVANQ